jgi:hypothetical protein
MAYEKTSDMIRVHFPVTVGSKIYLAIVEAIIGTSQNSLLILVL